MPPGSPGVQASRLWRLGVENVGAKSENPKTQPISDNRHKAWKKPRFQNTLRLFQKFEVLGIKIVVDF
jgi:hypothetical protein